MSLSLALSKIEVLVLSTIEAKPGSEAISQPVRRLLHCLAAVRNDTFQEFLSL
ncbi:MAG: hypothetical protein Fur0043_14210 [Anaerolineales bacterium]